MANKRGVREKVLALLKQHGELTGAHLLKLDSELPPGTVYTTLARLEKEGLLISRVEKIPGEQTRPRRFYSLTPTAGKRDIFYTSAARQLELARTEIAQLKDKLQESEKRRIALVYQLISGLKLIKVPHELYKSLDNEHIQMFHDAIYDRRTMSEHFIALPGDGPGTRRRYHPDNEQHVNLYGDLIDRIDAAPPSERPKLKAQLKQRIRQVSESKRVGTKPIPSPTVTNKTRGRPN